MYIDDEFLEHVVDAGEECLSVLGVLDHGHHMTHHGAHIAQVKVVLHTNLHSSSF